MEELFRGKHLVLLCGLVCDQTHPLPRGGSDFIASNRPFISNGSNCLPAIPLLGVKLPDTPENKDLNLPSSAVYSVA